MYKTCSPVMYQLRVRTTGASFKIVMKRMHKVFWSAGNHVLFLNTQFLKDLNFVRSLKKIS